MVVATFNWKVLLVMEPLLRVGLSDTAVGIVLREKRTQVSVFAGGIEKKRNYVEMRMAGKGIFDNIN